ncbi:hypothetical protein Tco_1241173, partial [Tanacetum coccineum]
MVGASSSDDKISNLDLDGTYLKSTYANSTPLSNKWERCNSIVLSWLLNSVSEELFLGQIFFDNASEVGHTVDRCFDIIGYPPGYNKNIGPKPNGPRTFNANSVSSSYEKGFASKQNYGDWLGHPSDQAVNMLQQDLNFTKDSHVSPCDICHKTKQTREPFPFSDHQTTEIGELIHLDLWGPYKV